MNPELRERLEKVILHHQLEASRRDGNLTRFASEMRQFHSTAAADIRAAIVSADDAIELLKMAEGYVCIEGSEPEAGRIERFLRPETGE